LIISDLKILKLKIEQGLIELTVKPCSLEKQKIK